MIFFIIAEADAASSVARAARPDVADLATFTPQHPRRTADRLIAWNEVYPMAAAPAAPEAGLWAAIEAAAARDDVCTAMLTELSRRHGLDLYGNAPAWFTTMARTTLALWANPRIGNISAEWRKPAVRPGSIEDSWLKCDFLDAATKQAIVALDARVGAPSRSARDQVRLCHHIFDLARGFLGEVTSYVARRVEKLFALQLCRSPALDADLGALLTAVRQTGPLTSFSFRSTEYLRYYLGQLALDLEAGPPATQLAVITALLDAEIGAAPPTDPPDELAAVTEIFTQLPSVIRKIILVNDLRKSFLAGSDVGMTAITLGPNNTYRFDRPPQPLPLEIDALVRMPSGWRSVQHWSPDERDPATRSVRQLLLSRWAGVSGHVAKNLDCYRTSLRDAYPAAADRAIPAALAALWRLYYDRRYSPAHTLSETCEGTTAGLPLDGHRYALTPTGAPGRTDPYDLFEEARRQVPARRASGMKGLLLRRIAVPGGTMVDGVVLDRLLHRRLLPGPAADLAGSTTKPLEAEIDAERAALTAAGYVVPRWSHELEPDTVGVGATHFRPPAAPPGGRRRRRRDVQEKAAS